VQKNQPYPKCDSTLGRVCAEDHTAADNKENKNRAHKISIARTHTWNCFLMECRWEKLSTPPRRAKRLPSAKPILELAKGFEPLTL
jgi:hypothetical protein